MKIGIYSPYLDSFGGGERYILTIAETLSKNHDVDLLIDEHLMSLDPENLKNKLSEQLDLDLSKINLVKSPLGKGSNFVSRLIFLRKYKILFYLTDGSIFYSTAKRNILHFQVPFKNIAAKNLWGKIKLSSWDLAICNSHFTEKIIEKEWPIKTQVIYPPVAVEKIKPLKKEKYILSVGRFVSFTKSKKHEEMIKIFSKMYQEGKLKDWSLRLAGSVEGDEEYLKELEVLAGETPVFLYPNLPFNELVDLYGHSSIYWHAAGFGEEDPTKMEHFGITTVEAMAGGCVPVVISKGGQVEIVEDRKSGFLWNNLKELEKLTLKLIKNPKIMSQLSKKAKERSKIFSKKHFEENIKNLITLL